MINRGPVDVLVMAAGEPKFDGSVFAELERQTAAGTIRVLDALLLMKDENGKVWGLDIEALPQEAKDAVGFLETGTSGLFDSEDSDILSEGMVPGSAVFAVAIEHVWAVGLVNALDHAGVEMAMHFRVPAPVVEEAFASLAVSN